MRATEFIREGGWDTALTQNTILKPPVVAAALRVIDQFVKDFNKFLDIRKLGPIARGRPTGSSAYHDVDTIENPDKIYGDIDLQMIGGPSDGKGYSQYAAYWNGLAYEFVETIRPQYVEREHSKPGHPIIKIGPDSYVQVDFMWHEEALRAWGVGRATPERGLKGVLTGAMFSTLGELVNMSIQHAGVQLKTSGGVRVPFTKIKDVEVHTISTNPKTYVFDVFKYLYQQIKHRPFNDGVKIDPLLQNNQGNDIDNIKVQVMVDSVKGFANSAEMNGMFGRGDLAAYTSAQDFLDKFLNLYEAKAMRDVNNKKRDKAATPDAIARADDDRNKVLAGLQQVKGLFT